MTDLAKPTDISPNSSCHKEITAAKPTNTNEAMNYNEDAFDNKYFFKCVVFF